MLARGWSRFVGAVLLSAVAACAPKTVSVPAPGAPHYPDFLQPIVPADLASSAAAVAQDRAWQFLQAGDLRSAEREAANALRLRPTFYPAEATRGYIELARKNSREAIAHFDRALAGRADDAAALVGKGQALAALNREDEALEAFEAALAVDRNLGEVARRAEVVRLRIVQRSVTAARQAVRAGKFDEAKETYRSAIERSPDSGFLHHELAVVERDHGDGDAAIEHYRRAAALDAGDADAFADLAEMLDARNDFDGALQAYDAALAAGGSPELTGRRDALRLRAEVARLPAEYRAIESAAQISRADLAALIGFRLQMLLTGARQRDVGVITDIRGHWAETAMLAVARAGLMDAFENHTFQPRAVIRREAFAQALTRLLARVATLSPEQGRRWQNARGRFPDVASGHLAYPAASTVVAAGVMAVAADGAFQPSRVVTGAEATESIRKIREMVDAAPAGGRRP